MSYIGNQPTATPVVTAAGEAETLDSTLLSARSSDAPIFTALTGEPNGNFANLNLVEEMMNTSSGLGLNVNPIAPVVVSQISGVAVANNALAVGGPNTANTQATGNPVVTGGVDSAGLSRRVLTDTAGRLQTAAIGVDTFGVQRQLGVAVSQNPLNVPAIPVQDVGQLEGLSQNELLNQILVEMKIMNQQIYAMMIGEFPPTDPALWRNELPAAF